MHEHIEGTLIRLSQEIDELEEKDEKLRSAQKRLEEERSIISKEKERIALVLKEIGLPCFSTSKYTLTQEYKDSWVYSEDPREKEKCIQWFVDRGLSSGYLNIDGRRKNKIAREAEEAGTPIPGITKVEVWKYNITKRG